MLRSKLIILSILLIGFAITGFQCSSTEITSAKLYIQQKNYEKAKTSLLQEIEKNPQSAEGHYLLGVVYGELGELNKAIAQFDESLSISTEYKDKIEESKRYYWANQFNRGVATYQKGINAEDKDSSNYYFEKSINYFENAAELQPDSADVYKNLAFVYMNAGRTEDAIKPLKKLIEYTHELDGYRYLGEILYNQGIQKRNDYKSTGEVQDSVDAQQYFNEAIDVLSESREYYPNNSDILLLLSNSYIAANKLEIAKETFKTGVEQEPENQYYRYNYGVLLLGAENYKEAEKQFLKAIEIDPDYQNAIYNLAVTYVRWGTKINKEAEENDEMDNQEYKEKYSKALPYLEQVVQMQENDAATWELLGKVYTVLGMQDKANQAFSKADQIRGL